MLITDISQQNGILQVLQVSGSNALCEMDPTSNSIDNGSIVVIFAHHLNNWLPRSFCAVCSIHDGEWADNYYAACSIHDREWADNDYAACSIPNPYPTSVFFGEQIRPGQHPQVHDSQ
ncbi:hypothetical protein E6O75_ATG08833 [Venturia nashicola]|uniref:Uncharacterized protein n=1 Tax=Venturia nashicola TaxID=86259 RepID=A0A4Z1NH85_9PEZI|nr:hypothetical protein E6O75_ATG08833 [Venturia nashicola]